MYRFHKKNLGYISLAISKAKKHIKTASSASLVVSSTNQSKSTDVIKNNK